MTMHLAKFELNRHAPTRALAGILNPADASRAADVQHNLIWTLFGDTEERQRDFLWRADGKGGFMTLSARPPRDCELFANLEVKAFAPAVRAGDRLAFQLRANATMDRSRATENRRVDVVMHALHQVPRDRSAWERPRIAQEQGESWLKRKGEANGFEAVEVRVTDYSQIEIGRPSPKRARFGVLELEGTLVVTDPAKLVEGLGRGFGRAKAWGCGLMLVRRAA